MSRSTVTASFRQAAESNFSDEVNLCFLTISHNNLLEPIRVVWDNKDYIYNTYTWTGFPFDITLLTDDDSPPKAQITIQNVDPRIGDTIRALSSPPRLKIELLSSVGFDITANPRTPLSPAPSSVYTADKLFLTNVRVDVMNVTGDIVGWDYLQRTWPGVRARQDIFPGLFR